MKILKLSIIGVLTLVLSLSSMSHFLPTEIDSISAQKINGGAEGTCTCCKDRNCADYGCGSGWHVTQHTAKAGACNCSTGTPNPCSITTGGCSNKRSQIEGQQCETGAC